MRSQNAPPNAADIEMYGGDVVLSFDPDDHVYYAASEDEDFGALISTTQVLDNLAKPALQYWAVNETVDYIEENWEPGRAYDEVEIDNMLQKAKKARFSSSGKATKIGSMVHDWIESFVISKSEGQDVEILEPGKEKEGDVETAFLTLPFNDKAQAAIQQFLNWEEDKEIEWIGAEQRAFSLGKRYAGTYDAEALIDGDLVLIDWKTSKRIYDEYPLQTASYVYAREEESYHVGDRIMYDRMMILRVPKNGGEFEALEIDDRQEIKKLVRVFFSLLTVHNWND